MTTYKELREKLGDELALCGEIDGEPTLLERGPDGSMKLTAHQDNGWARVHYYYEDGTFEETFER